MVIPTTREEAEPIDFSGSLRKTEQKGARSHSFRETSISLITELENTSNERSYRCLVSTEANIVNTISESESSNVV